MPAAVLLVLRTTKLDEARDDKYPWCLFLCWFSLSPFGLIINPDYYYIGTESYFPDWNDQRLLTPTTVTFFVPSIFVILV